MRPQQWKKYFNFGNQHILLKPSLTNLIDIMVLNPAKKSNQMDARTYYMLGERYRMNKDYDKAIKQYNMAILLNPVFSEAYFNRAFSYYYIKNYDKAIEDYSKAIELDPNNPIIHNNRGDANYRKGQYKESIKDYDKAIQLNPEYLKAYYNRGLAYASTEEYDKAIEDFKRVVELNPNFAEAHHLLGLAQEYSGDLEGAVKSYTTALKFKPDLIDAKTHLEDAKTKLTGGDGGAGGEGGQGDKKKSTIALVEKPNMTFKQVAGMKKLKQEIKEAIVYPMSDPDLARKYGKLGGGGVLLYGPPGCGKTYIMKAAAGECAIGFINAKLSDLMDMYVGNTEKNIRKVYDLARKNSPAIIFFDEVDAIGGRRDQQQGQQYMRMAVNEMLVQMDGIESKNQNVLVVAASNAPWDVDPALRRSGRFSKKLYVGEPDFASRVAILKIHSRNRPLETNIAFIRMGLATMGYSSADLKLIADEAATYPWREAFMKTQKRTEEYIQSGMSKEDAEKKARAEVVERKINTGDFIKALRKVKSSLPPWYEQAKKQIGEQEEVELVDGKKHVRKKESKMGAGERDQFKKLLDVIKGRNAWYYKWMMKILRVITLYIPIPF